MLSKLRQRLTYANVMSTLAVFIALGGSSYAAFTISGSSIKNRSIPAKKLKRNTLTGTGDQGVAPGPVPRARNADRLGGLTAADLRSAARATRSRPPTSASSGPPRAATLVRQRGARSALRSARPRGPAGGCPPTASSWPRSRRCSLLAGGELTSNVYPSSTDPGRLDVLVRHRPGRQRRAHARHAPAAKAFRCVTDPLN